MRWINWRRMLAVIALVVGFGAGAGIAPAAAADGSSAARQSVVSPMDDFWW
jgi:hypothetical protein